MIFGNEMLLELLKRDKITIKPFNENQLMGVSYDLRLDKYFILPTLGFNYSVNPQDPSIDGFDCTRFILDSYCLKPLQRVLASTIETAGSNSLDITTKIFSKSSWARWGLEVCSCAGYGDPMYANHWTLEIFNKNPFPIILRQGMVIAQIGFEEVEGCSKEYKSQYNNEGNIKKFTDAERFEMMIPKKIKIIE